MSFPKINLNDADRTTLQFWQSQTLGQFGGGGYSTYSGNAQQVSGTYQGVQMSANMTIGSTGLSMDRVISQLGTFAQLRTLLCFQTY
ncbi:MAG: hypothetical protein EZS28_024235 [Streblomastix strix]|uniref:Uncharacterized protein n=1 Tax=Streblomastix strix TaxID=222440 RepID=A0A5J4VCP7_9EUKA|nr:MAG: hypothetical protein EZS28_024235 [Streblomastix strix]